MEKINKIQVNGVTYEIGNSSVDSIIETTYAELKSLKESNSLTVGQQYRITDYETTFKSKNISEGVKIPRVKSAKHRFDLIVKANSTNSFEALAKAAKNKDDSYFDNSNLDAWTIYYCFDNDNSAYLVDASCKGYIYRMIDEYNNDANFDFKNALMAVSCNIVHNISDSLNNEDETNKFAYFYLFSYVESTSISDIKSPQDASMLGYAKNNKIILSTNLNSINPINGRGFVLLVTKGLLPSSRIEGNIINSPTTFIFCYNSLSSIILNNKIENAEFLIRNICKEVQNNIILNGAELQIGVQNWVQDSYNHIMGEISGNFVFPDSKFLCFGTSKNNVSFKENAIFTKIDSRINSDYNINRCKIEGSFSTSTVLDSQAENMYILGNGTETIRKVAIYDIGN